MIGVFLYFSMYSQITNSLVDCDITHHYQRTQEPCSYYGLSTYGQCPTSSACLIFGIFHSDTNLAFSIHSTQFNEVHSRTFSTQHTVLGLPQTVTGASNWTRAFITGSYTTSSLGLVCSVGYRAIGKYDCQLSLQLANALPALHNITQFQTMNVYCGIILFWKVILRIFCCIAC